MSFRDFRHNTEYVEQVMAALSSTYDKATRAIEIRYCCSDRSFMDMVKFVDLVRPRAVFDLFLLVTSRLLI